MSEWVKVAHSCPTLCDPMSPWNSLGQKTGVGSLSLQGPSVEFIKMQALRTNFKSRLLTGLLDMFLGSFFLYLSLILSFGPDHIIKGAAQVALVVKNTPANVGDVRGCRFNPWVRKTPWRRAWQPPPVFLAGEFHRWRSLADYRSCGRKESDTTEVT